MVGMPKLPSEMMREQGMRVAQTGDLIPGEFDEIIGNNG